MQESHHHTECVYFRYKKYIYIHDIYYLKIVILAKKNCFVDEEKMENGKDVLGLQPSNVILPKGTRVVVANLGKEEFNGQRAPEVPTSHLEGE